MPHSAHPLRLQSKDGFLQTSLCASTEIAGGLYRAANADERDDATPAVCEFSSTFPIIEELHNLQRMRVQSIEGLLCKPCHRARRAPNPIRRCRYATRCCVSCEQLRRSLWRCHGNMDEQSVDIPSLPATATVAVTLQTPRVKDALATQSTQAEPARTYELEAALIQVYVASMLHLSCFAVAYLCPRRT